MHVECTDAWLRFRNRPLTRSETPSGCQDLNLRPPDPQSGALPSCATSRYSLFGRKQSLPHLTPSQVRYQAAPQPVTFTRLSTLIEATRLS